MRWLSSLAVAGILFSFLAAGCASTDWESRYLEKDQEVRALQAQYDLQRQATAERDATNEEIRQEYNRAKEQVEVLSRRLDNLKNAPPPPPVTDTETARLQSELDRLRRLNMDATMTDDGNIEITLDADVSFASGSHALTRQGKATLDSVARELNGEFSGNLVQVIGHTDSDPIRKSPYEDNWELGAERALGVIRYLHDAHKVAAGRLVAASRGENSPITKNSTKEGKAKNRRVEIVVIISRQQIVGALQHAD
jgi:chemotaxis protein MotB